MLAVGGGSLGYTLNNRLRLEQAKWESINHDQEEISQRRAQIKSILDSGVVTQKDEEPSSTQSKAQPATREPLKLIVQPGMELTKFTLYEPSPPIGTLRLQELLKNVKDVASNKDVRDFTLYQTAAFLNLDRLLKEIQTTKQNH